MRYHNYSRTCIHADIHIIFGHKDSLPSRFVKSLPKEDILGLSFEFRQSVELAGNEFQTDGTKDC